MGSPQLNSTWFSSSRPTLLLGRMIVHSRGRSLAGWFQLKSTRFKSARSTVLSSLKSPLKPTEQGPTHSLPSVERFHPSGATTLENQLLAVPPVRSSNWNGSDNSGAKPSKVIHTASPTRGFNSHVVGSNQSISLRTAPGRRPVGLPYLKWGRNGFQAEWLPGQLYENPPAPTSR